MITGITIENFKGIKERVDLELRPITLLFGANSAGKSTILHALHYAREIFERRNLDADLTVTGGKFIDLGGFRNMIHNHDLCRCLTIGIEFSTSESEIPIIRESVFADEAPPPLLNTTLTNVRSSSVECEIVWRPSSETPFVRKYSTFINGRRVVSVDAVPGRKGQTLEIDLLHPNLSFESNFDDFDVPHSIVDDTNYPKTLARTKLGSRTRFTNLAFNMLASGMLPDKEDKQLRLSDDGTSLYLTIEIDTGHDALPELGCEVDFDVDHSFYRTQTHKIEFGGMELDVPNLGETPQVWEPIFREIVAEVVGGLGKLARSKLRMVRYIGPLRETPRRNYAPPRFPSVERWASGLGAWDALYNGSDELVKAVGDWMEDPDRLDAKCRVDRKKMVELDLGSELIRKLITKRSIEVSENERLDLDKLPQRMRVFICPSDPQSEQPDLEPNDVGVGMSQIIPVIVAALADKERLVAIEQPELHVHPRLQTEIADLFIEAFLKNRTYFLLETHSEHLILRLLRRIRETEKNTQPTTRELRTHDLAIYYARQVEGATQIERIDVDVNGEFIQPWPDDFFEIDFYERFN